MNPVVFYNAFEGQFQPTMKVDFACCITDTGKVLMGCKGVCDSCGQGYQGFINMSIVVNGTVICECLKCGGKKIRLVT